MNTPTDIDDLSHRAAQALLQAINTDRWPSAREWITGYLANTSTDPTPVLTEVEHSRTLLAHADADEAAILRKAATKALAIRLRQASTNHRTAGEELRTFLAEQPEPTPPGTPHVVQNAYATKKSQVFQSAGSQHITLGDRRQHPHD